MLIQNPSISTEEATRSKHAGMLTLAGLAIDQATRNLYSSPKSLCVDADADHQRMICLYLFMYAADYWCEEDCCSMTEAQYLAVISRIEELQQECCDFKLEGVFIPGSVDEIPGSGGVTTGVSTFVLEFNVSEGQDGLTSITNSMFAGVRVEVIRGSLNLPGIPQPEDNYYYSKPLASPTVTFSHPLVEGEYIKITTIPL